MDYFELDADEMRRNFEKIERRERRADLVFLVTALGIVVALMAFANWAIP